MKQTPRTLKLPGDRVGLDRRLLLRGLGATAGIAMVEGCASALGATPTRGRPGSPSASIALPPAIRDEKYRLVQDWDFGNNIKTLQQLRELFFTRYIYDKGRLDTLNDEWERYRDNDNHVFEDGALALVARAPEGLVRGKIESGMLRSKWSGEYGYFECRMKVPPGRGLWPAFWLNPQDAKWPPEIDIVEIVNNGRDTTHNSFHYVHSGSPTGRRDVISILNNNHTYKHAFDYSDDYHVFAAEWTQTRVRHFVDDVMIVEREFEWVHRDGTDGGPAHVLLNLAVGGSWPGPPQPGVLPAKLLIDYVRIWQRPA